MKRSLIAAAVFSLGVFTSAFGVEDEKGIASNCVRTQDGANVSYTYDCNPAVDPHSYCKTTNGSTTTIHCECHDAGTNHIVSSDIKVISESFSTDSDGTKHWRVIVQE